MSQASLVLKFGGTSVATPEHVRRVADIVAASLPRAPLVVVSAIGRTTRDLVAAAEQAERGAPGSLGGRVPWRAEEGDSTAEAGDIVRGLVAPIATTHRALVQGLFATPPAALVAALERELAELEQLLRGVMLLRELSARAADTIAARGELLSSAILHATLNDAGLAAELFDVRRVLATDDRHGSARPRVDRLATLATSELAPRLAPGRAVVTQGYVGATADGITTTLGREGSDYSAALLGAALGAAEVQIWTDVSGVLTADPARVPAARTIPVLSFREARALTAFGAKVLHPATLQPAIEAGIPVTVRNTADPEGLHSTISAGPGARALTGVASRGGLDLLDLIPRRPDPGVFLSQVFEALSRHRVEVEAIARSEAGLRVLVPSASVAPRLLAELQEIATVGQHAGRALVGVVGERLRSTPGVASRVAGALDDAPLDLVSLGADPASLAFVVAEADAEQVVRRLHRALFEDEADGRDA